MSERQDQTQGIPEGFARDGIEALFAAARAEPPAALPDALMRRLLADAAASQPRRAPVVAARPSALARIWDGLQEVFGGKPGLAGAVFASCTAFSVGVVAPDAAAGWIGLEDSLYLVTLESAALDIGADPSVLWSEE